MAKWIIVLLRLPKNATFVEFNSHNSCRDNGGTRVGFCADGQIDDNVHLSTSNNKACRSYRSTVL